MCVYIIYYIIYVGSSHIAVLRRLATMIVTVLMCMCVYVCVCVFIKLHITAQSGPVVLVILCHSR